MKKRESVIEKEVSEFAISKGWMSLKLSSPGSRGIPDRMFLKDRKIIFIEFKAINGILSYHQKRMFKIFSDKGFRVLIVNDIETGKSYF